MFCHQCGSPLRDDTPSCGSCGADVRAADLEATQPIPRDGTMRLGPPTEPPGAAVTAAAARGAASTPRAVSSAKRPRYGGALFLLFFVAVFVGSFGVGAYRWLGRGPASLSVSPAVATPVEAASSTTEPATVAPVAPPTADPTGSAPAATGPASGPGSGPALLAEARKERDAAVAERDAALDQVRQLQTDLTHARAAATVAATAPAGATGDPARVAQLEKEHDTVRFIVGTRKQLVANKVIESHLYLLPPPEASLTSLALSQTTDITIDAKAYGLNTVKDLVVIPSSVWQDTDYKYAVAGSSVKFSILRPDAFRTLARYFVIMVE